MERGARVRILGVDPGYAILGYGVIDTTGAKLSVVDYGVIETQAGEAFPARLARLYTGMRTLLERYSPDEAAFEELFFARNTSTALAVGAGRGVALLAAEQAGIALPSSCRNGSCRTCLCRLVQGDIRWRIDWPGLSPDEKREGWILPCVASACSDLVLESTPVRWDQA